METKDSPFQKYIFVCENERSEGDCCAPEGNILREVLKTQLKEMGLATKIRVSRSGCLDVCSQGPNVLLMPDNVWFNQVEEKDVPMILKKALEGIS